MIIDENTPIPESAIMKLSVRAYNVFSKMSFPKTYAGVKAVTYDMVMNERNAGAKTAREIMEFRSKLLEQAGIEDLLCICSNETAQIDIPRVDEELPPIVIQLLSKRTRGVIEENKIKMTPRGISELDYKSIKSFPRAGDKVAAELMTLKAKCLSGDIWNVLVEDRIEPENYNSLSEFVMAVANKICTRINPLKEKVLADYLGLLNVERKKTLEEVGSESGGVSRERIRQIAKKLESEMFSEGGKAIFAKFVNVVKVIFDYGNGIVKGVDLIAGVSAAYPQWAGTTKFSVLQLLKYYGIEIEENESGRIAWMSGGRIGCRYKTFLSLLDNLNVPLENLTLDAILTNADSIGLSGITEDEYMFLVYRSYEKDGRIRGDDKSRWALFLKLRCGMRVGDAAKRRYVVSLALRKAGMRGLTYNELVSACKEIDPSIDIGDEKNVLSDADITQCYDMDGTGVRLIVYDFGNRIRDKRYSLDIFFKDDDLIKVIKKAGEQLREHMEKNSLGVVNVTRLCKGIVNELPKKYEDGLPLACFYFLLRDLEAGGLKYYDCPKVAHPCILDENGKAPEQAISWVIYEYFIYAGHKTATWAQLLDFCEVMLGMDCMIAASTVLPVVKGNKIVVNGEEHYELRAPNEKIAPPNVLIVGGEFDSQLSFSRPRNALGINLDAEGKARDINTYVRLFLFELAKAKYSFTQDEESQLSDPRWCEKNLGVNKPMFVRKEYRAQRPSTTYWKTCYRIGGGEYWVSDYWAEKYKFKFDKWAEALAKRAGFTFVPYEIPLEE